MFIIGKNYGWVSIYAAPPLLACFEDHQELFIVKCIFFQQEYIFFAVIYYKVEPIIIKMQHHSPHVLFRGIGLHNKQFCEV